MLRRFAPDVDRPSPDQLRAWHIGRMFDDDGTPIDVEAGLIIQQFIDSPDATISAIIVSRRTKLNPFHVRSYCRQMCAVDVLQESPPLSACFTLNKNPNDFALSLIQEIRDSCRKFQ